MKQSENEKCASSSLSQLVSRLVSLLEFSSETPSSEIMKCLSDYRGTDWETCAFWDDSLPYTRNLIVRNQNFALILLCWNPGKSSAIHSHSNSECFMKCLAGQIQETVFAVGDSDGKLNKLTERTVLPHDVPHINDAIGAHRMGTPTSSRSVTLHVYVPAYEMCTMYESTNVGGKPSITSCPLTYYSSGGIKS